MAEMTHRGLQEHSEFSVSLMRSTLGGKIARLQGKQTEVNCAAQTLQTCSVHYIRRASRSQTNIQSSRFSVRDVSTMGCFGACTGSEPNARYAASVQQRMVYGPISNHNAQPAQLVASRKTLLLTCQHADHDRDRWMAVNIRWHSQQEDIDITHGATKITSLQCWALQKMCPAGQSTQTYPCNSNRPDCLHHS